jgi:hypothetical protein
MAVNRKKSVKKQTSSIPANSPSNSKFDYSKMNPNLGALTGLAVVCIFVALGILFLISTSYVWFEALIIIVFAVALLFIKQGIEAKISSAVGQTKIVSV